MKSALTIVLATLTFVPICNVASKDLPHGKDLIGFKQITLPSQNGVSFKIGLWYPAAKESKSMTFEDYLKAENLLHSPDSFLFNDFKGMLKFRFKMEVTEQDFLKARNQRTKSFKDAEMKPGKFPVILTLASAYDYYETFEFLASHGKVIAAITCNYMDDPPSPDGPHHYTRYTAAMEMLLNYIQKQAYSDVNTISVLGHGFSINPAMYLAMQNPSIKKVINLDGGFFGPRSKSQNSADYHPEKLTMPLLYLVTTKQDKEDDQSQVHAINSPIVKAEIISAHFNHADFTCVLRVDLNELNERRKANPDIDDTYNEAHLMMLLFLDDKTVTASSHILVE